MSLELLTNLHITQTFDDTVWLTFPTEIYFVIGLKLLWAWEIILHNLRNFFCCMQVKYGGRGNKERNNNKVKGTKKIGETNVEIEKSWRLARSGEATLNAWLIRSRRKKMINSPLCQILAQLFILTFKYLCLNTYPIDCSIKNFIDINSMFYLICQTRTA